MTSCPTFMILNMILLLALFILSLVCPLIHTMFFVKEESSYNIQEILLRYALFFNVGCLFLLGFLGQVIYSKEIASSLIWPWSPFQYELSFSELAIAILGLSCGLFNYQFWLATILCSVIWLLGASGIHIYYDFVYSTNIISNSVFVVYWNIFIVGWLIFLYLYYLIQDKRSLRELFS